MKGLKRLDDLEPSFKEECLVILEALERTTGIEWMVVQGPRTIGYQDGLFKQPFDGKDNDGDGKIDEADEKVTNAKGGSSPHNFKQAIDVVPIKNGEPWWNAPKQYWEALGQIVEGTGNVWGGHFKSIYDPMHLEDDDWKEDYALWKKGELKIG